MIRYFIVPRDDKPYLRPTPGEVTTYRVYKQGDDAETIELEIVVQLQVDWAKSKSMNDVIRIEGYRRAIDGPQRVLGFYELNSTSTESHLGMLEIQDA